MKKKITVIMAMLVLVIGIISCTGVPTTTVASSNQKNPLERVGYYLDFYEYRDTETGVHYFVYKEGNYSVGFGCAMIPRYNADGTLYVD